MSVLSPDNPGTSFGTARLPLMRDDPIFNLTDWADELFPNQSFIGSETHEKIRGLCKDVLVTTIGGYWIRYWDMAILIPNLFFLLFLFIKYRTVRKRMRKNKSPVYKAFFFLICFTTLLNVARCTVSISVSFTQEWGELVDKILWICLKCAFLTAELAVLSFGLLFGHLDSGWSILKASLFTLVLSLAHSAAQTVLEFKLLDRNLFDDSGVFDLHSHGGLALWAVTSALFVVLYLAVLCLPLTCVRNYVTLPSKGAFVLYCSFLAFLNLMQTFGATLIFFDIVDGMCVVDLTTYIYFTLFTPSVYFTFLRRTLHSAPAPAPGGLFSYRQQKDERGTGEMPESYYPRFSGLQSPSYDDLFEATRENRFPYPYDAPLMLNDTAESTVTTRTGSDDYERRFDSMDRGPRQLKGLGTNGTLVFSDDEQPYPPPWASSTHSYYN